MLLCRSGHEAANSCSQPDVPAWPRTVRGQCVHFYGGELRSASQHLDHLQHSDLYSDHICVTMRIMVSVDAVYAVNRPVTRA